MKDGEEPEIYTFTEDSSMGVLEGTVIIKEVAAEAPDE